NQREREGAHPEELAGDGHHACRHHEREIPRKERGSPVEDQAVKASRGGDGRGPLPCHPILAHIAPTDRTAEKQGQAQCSAPKPRSTIVPWCPRTETRSLHSARLRTKSTTCRAQKER